MSEIEITDEMVAKACHEVMRAEDEGPLNENDAFRMVLEMGRNIALSQLAARDAEILALRAALEWIAEEEQYAGEPIPCVPKHSQEGMFAKARQALTSTAPTAETHDRKVRNEALEEAAKVVISAYRWRNNGQELAADIRSLIQEGEQTPVSEEARAWAAEQASELEGEDLPSKSYDEFREKVQRAQEGE